MHRLYVTVHIPKAFTDQEARDISNAVRIVLLDQLKRSGDILGKPDELEYEGRFMKATDSNR